MSDERWKQIRISEALDARATQLVEAVSGEGLSFTLAQVLSRAVAVGIESLEANPKLMIPGRARKKASA